MNEPRKGISIVILPKKCAIINGNDIRNSHVDTMFKEWLESGAQELTLTVASDTIPVKDFKFVRSI